MVQTEEEVRLMGSEMGYGSTVGQPQQPGANLGAGPPKPNQQQDAWSGMDAGLYTIMAVVFLGDMSRGIYFPTLSTYVHSMGGTRVTQGFCVAGFSFGRVLSSPILGGWADRHGYRQTLLFTCSIIMLGALLYALASSTNMLLVAQVLMGIGSGTLGVTRAYVSERTPNREKTGMLSLLTSVQYAGFTVTPLLGSLLCRIIGDGVPNTYIFNGFFRWEWTKFTAPGPFMAVMCLITMALIARFLTDEPTTEDATAAAQQQQQQRPSQKAPLDSPAEEISSKTKAAIFGCFLLNIATKGTIACYETLGAHYAIAKLDLSHSSIGVFFAVFGALGVVSLLCMRCLSHMYNDVQLIVGGGVFMMVSCALLLDPTDLAFTISIFLQYSIGYPIGHTAVLGLVSKVIGKRPQGTLQGMFASAGSVARICFPILAGLVAELFGLGAVFALLVVVLAITLAALVAFRHTYLAYCDDVTR